VARRRLCTRLVGPLVAVETSAAGAMPGAVTLRPAASWPFLVHSASGGASANGSTVDGVAIDVEAPA
jgi:hypothetical protein